NLREQRVGSRDITVRAVQSAVDKRRLAKGKGRPVMKQKHVERRVDEFFDVARREADQRKARLIREAQEAGHAGDELKVKVKGIEKGVRKRTDHDFARQFGGEAHP